MTRWARAAGVLLLCSALLAGCSSVAASPDRGPGGSGFHLAQIEGDRFSKPRTIAVDRVSTPPANQYEWTVTSVDPSSRQLRLSYTDGACTGADRSTIEESATAVVIGITASKSFQGNCIAVGIPRVTTITLRKPLGGRALMEGATGVNDGLPKVSDPSTLPSPTCAIEEGSARDVPVGFPSASTRLAPPNATKVFVCRTWWPKGSAHMESTTITDPVEIAALATAIDTKTDDLHPAGGAAALCDQRLRGSWFDLYFEGPGVRVEVKADEINCLTITNGAASGTITPALAKTLDPLFPA